MRVAYVGNFDPEYSTENDVRKAFEHLGHEVIKLQENRTTVQQLADAAFASDLLLFTGTWDDALPLKETVDIIRQCGMRGIPTATLHLDIFHGSDRGDRKWWLHPMFQTAYVFTADGGHQDEWRRMGVNHYWLKPAVRHDAAHFGTYREEYACDVAFVGSNGVGYHVGAWPYRKQLVDELREMCRRNGWSWRNPGGDHPKVERGEDLNDFYASAKVTVGDSLCLDRERSLYCSDRVYEATGRGGFLIMPKLDFLIHDFHAVFPMYEWGNWSQLEDRVRTYLELPNANQDTRQAMQKVTADEHTYVNRIQEMLEVIGRQ